MIEGSENQGGEPPRSEGDLLAERRARRAAESGEVILTRRAEAAEATVQTLERHVSTLQQRLQEAEDDLRRTRELLDVERAAALEREHELQRVKQREYAEQQLRVETEERLGGLDRESRAETDRLSQRLSAAEQDAHELTSRLESMQRQLAEAEHAAAAEQAAVRRAEAELQQRLIDLESRTSATQEGLATERAARERSETLLAEMRQGNLRLEGLVGEMKGIVERLNTAIHAEAQIQEPQLAMAPPPARRPEVEGNPETTLAVEQRGAEMADALAAAVERLRARAEAAPALSPASIPVPVVRPTHKHALSLIGRWRNRRKQRRSS